MSYENEEVSAFPCEYDAPLTDRKKVIGYCKLEALKVLPEGTVYEIRGKSLSQSSDYGRVVRTEQEVKDDWGIGWYWNDCPVENMQDAVLFESSSYKFENLPNKGYMIYARYKT